MHNITSEIHNVVLHYISRRMNSFRISLSVEEEIWNWAGYIFTEHGRCIFLRITGKLFFRIHIITCHNTIIFYRLTILHVPIPKDSYYWISVSSHVITTHVTPRFHGSNNHLSRAIFCLKQELHEIYIFSKVYSLRLRHMAHLNQFALNC
jgi:hypothetical protein